MSKLSRALVEQNKLDFNDIDVSNDHALREKISRENGGFRTVPMIMVGDIFIGGYDDLMTSVKSGQFEQLLG